MYLPLPCCSPNCHSPSYFPPLALPGGRGPSGRSTAAAGGPVRRGRGGDEPHVAADAAALVPLPVAKVHFPLRARKVGRSSAAGRHSGCCLEQAHSGGATAAHPLRTGSPAHGPSGLELARRPSIFVAPLWKFLGKHTGCLGGRTHRIPPQEESTSMAAVVREFALVPVSRWVLIHSQPVEAVGQPLLKQSEKKLARSGLL